MPPTERIQYHTAVLTYKARNLISWHPQYLTSKFSTVAGQHGHATHLTQSSDLKVPQPNLHPSTRTADSVKAFKAGYCRSVLG